MAERKARRTFAASIGSPVAVEKTSRPVPTPPGRVTCWRRSSDRTSTQRAGKAIVRRDLQRTDDEKVSKERMHLDLATDDIEAEVQRLEALGATRYDHQQGRGF
jgi:Glyoxalase-like domain